MSSAPHDAPPEKGLELEAQAEEALDPGLPEEEWPPWAQTFIAAMEKSPSASRAAEAAGVDRRTPYRLRDRSEAFRLAWHDAREKSLDLLEETIFRMGTSGLTTKKTVTKTDAEGKVLEVTETEEIVRSPTLAMFYLKRWRPEYRERYSVEHSGPGEGPIPVEVTHVDETLARFRDDLERLGNTNGVAQPAPPALPVIVPA